MQWMLAICGFYTTIELSPLLISNAIIETAIRCVVSVIEHDIKTLVACGAGMSRSPAIAAAAMAIVAQRPPDNCLNEITTNAPHDVSPILWTRVKQVYNQIATSGHRTRAPNVAEQSDERER